MAEIAHADLSNLIGDIYDCALDPSLWPTALEGVSGVLNTRNALLLGLDPRTMSARIFYQWGNDPTRWVAFVEKYAAINPLATAGWHMEIDEPLRLQSFMDPEEFRRTRFFKEFVAPAAECDMVGAVVQKSALRYTAISANRGEEVGVTGERELELMGLLAPHIRRAATIHDALDAKGRRISNLCAALDLAAGAIFLLDGEGRLQRRTAPPSAFSPTKAQPPSSAAASCSPTPNSACGSPPRSRRAPPAAHAAPRQWCAVAAGATSPWRCCR